MSNPLDRFEITGLDGVPELMCNDCPDFFLIAHQTLPQVIETAYRHVRHRHPISYVPLSETIEKARNNDV